MDKIKIGYKIYEVIKTKANDILTTNGSLCYGQIDYNENKIYLNEDMTDESTLLHEIIHGIDDMYSIELSEKQVEMLATGLYIAIKDNDLKILNN